MRKKYQVSFIVIMLLVIMGLLACNGKTQTLYEMINDDSGIVSVSIMNGSNGNIKSYTDEEDLGKLKEYMQQVRCTPNSDAPPSSGWSYRFQVTTKNGNMNDIIFAGSNSKINTEKYNLIYPELEEFIPDWSGIEADKE